MGQLTPCGPGPSSTHLPCHKEQKRRLLLFGFVLGNDLLSYWLYQLLGGLRLSVILRICDAGKTRRSTSLSDRVAVPEGVCIQGLKFPPGQPLNRKRASPRDTGLASWVLRVYYRHLTE